MYRIHVQSSILFCGLSVTRVPFTFSRVDKLRRFPMYVYPRNLCFLSSWICSDAHNDSHQAGVNMPVH